MIKTIIKILKFKKLIISVLSFYAKLHPNQIILRDGIKYAVDLSKLIDVEIFLGGWEKSTIKFLKQNLKYGDSVIEVGANIGAHSLLISKLIGEKGHLIAIEPTEYALKKLKFNIELNKNISNITVVDKIISDIQYKGSGTFNSDWSTNSLQAPQQIEFYSSTIDRLVEDNDLQKVDMLKVDVDGYDFRVLKGARKTIEKFRPIIFVELCEYTLNEKGNSVFDIFSYLNRFGYKCFSESDNREIKVDELIAFVGLDRSINGIFKII
jgi:FkbM family methyltransferase